jgi:hypothetical protein
MARFEEMLEAKSSDTDVVAEDYYPGSKKKRKAVTGAETKGGWDSIPKLTLEVRGKDVEFYTLGVLAEMLDRLPQTVRKWERQGYLPVSKYRTPGRTKNGQKRIYTRLMIEGIVKIAREEGVLGNASSRKVGNTKFSERVEALFNEMGVLG